MPDLRQKAILTFGGGWATDFGPVVPNPPKDGVLSLPFLLAAENCIYELDGAPRKVGGTTRINTTATSTIFGFHDAWFQGTAAAETQLQVAYAGTTYQSMADLDGTWTERASGLESGKHPCFEMFRGTSASEILIMTTTSTVDAPRTMVNTGTVATLGGTPPQFSFMVKHQNRLWASGVATLPSRLYYSESLDPTTWTGGGSGSLDIDPGDGDRITGLASHKNELIVFKGPNRLSIHRITGATPSTFARVPFVDGVGSYNHSSIFRVNDDLVFADPRGLHSLTATAAYGDYIEAFLSRPIMTAYQNDINQDAMSTIWGANYQGRGIAVWLLPSAGGSVKNTYYVYDYRFQPGRWALWTSYENANCIGTILSPTRLRLLHGGSAAGFLFRFNASTRTIANGATAYRYYTRTPYVNFGTSAMMKNAVAGFLSAVPKGNYSTTFGWTRDINAEQTVAIGQQGAGSTLG